MIGIYQRWSMGGSAYKEGGQWTQEELAGIVPQQLLTGVENPSPAQEGKIVWPWIRP